jgi:hypothetical protein
MSRIVRFLAAHPTLALAVAAFAVVAAAGPGTMFHG